MVSEDSDQLGSGLLMIHGCDDLDEIGKAGPRKVSAMLHLFDAIGELVEVRSLSRSQWILPEEGDNHPAQVRALSYHEPMKRLVVIVIPPYWHRRRQLRSTSATPRGIAGSLLLE